MRIFISAGEPSGDLHGANLIRTLKRFDPNITFVGFGGDRMAGEGCHLLYPLCQLAIMWFVRIMAKLPTFLSLASLADRYFHHQRPDLVILIDYPGFNGVIGRRAHFRNIPVIYFGPPQLWGWGGWRVKGLRKWVDHILCKLPFEEAWFAERGVQAKFVGHPYFDELHSQKLDTSFVQKRKDTGRPIIGLLPGSRTQEVSGNFQSIARAASLIHKTNPETRFLVACYKESHLSLIQSELQRYSFPVEVHVGKTPEIIDLAHSCISVSGSVSLELLHRETPSVIIYRVGKLSWQIGNYFKTSPYITLVNMMAEKELFPEFLVDHCPAKELSGQILTWLDQPETHAEIRQELRELRQQVGQPGACQRTAEFIWSLLQGEDKQEEMPMAA